MLKHLTCLHHSLVFSTPEPYTSQQHPVSATVALEPMMAPHKDWIQYRRQIDLGMHQLIMNEPVRHHSRLVKYVHGFMLRRDPATQLYEPIRIRPLPYHLWPQVDRVPLERDNSG